MMRNSKAGSTAAHGFTLLELILVLGVITMITSLGVPSVSRMLARARFKEGVFALQADLTRTRLLAMKNGEIYLFRYSPRTGIYEILPQRIAQAEDKMLGSAGGSIGLPSGSMSVQQNHLLNTLQSSRSTLPNGLFFSGGILSDTTGYRTLDIPLREKSERSLGGGTGNIIGSLQTPPQSSFTQNSTVQATPNLPQPGLGVEIPQALPLPNEISTSQAPVTPFPSADLVGGSIDYSGTGVSPWSESVYFYPNGRTSSIALFLTWNDSHPYFSEISLRGLTGLIRVSSISASPPGSSDFPSILPPEAFAVLRNTGTPVGNGLAGTTQTGAMQAGTVQAGTVQTGTARTEGVR